MSLPPDLRVVCRKLAAASPTDLPALCPVLVGHILRCGEPLSASSEQQGKNKASEASVLVHKLKTQIRTLLQGKTSQGRFAGTVLAKAVVDAGGWESLRTTEPWVRALLSLLQKPDPFASKELAIITLTRIYTLLQGYPTLVREIATPTIPTFATACLQLIRPIEPGQPPKAPMKVVETVTRALSALIPLYPTTLRPFVVQIKAAIRPFIAPTSSDDLVVPVSLRRSSRHLLALLHYTAAKNGNSEEWLKLFNSLIVQAHSTADQVFRAIREARDPGSDYAAGQVSVEAEPNGGGDSVDELPHWTGIQSGAERLIGLIETITEFFHFPTKLPVAVPLGAVSGLVSRVSVILAPGPDAQDRDSTTLINPSIAREERDGLWSILPNIQAASLELLSSMVKRMGANIVPLVPEILEEATRMFAANCVIPRVRKVTFVLVRDILLLVGPSLARISVDSLIAVVHACCHDILETSGHLQKDKADEKPGQNGANGSSKSKAPFANVDLFLRPGSAANGAAQASKTARLELAHLSAAESLLATVLSYVPQQHVKKADRALLDRTAIISANKDAMVSSVLQPYVDNTGRYFANTIPFLARAYPHDIDMEVLRSNLRTVPHYFGNIFAATIPGEDDDDDESIVEDEDMLEPDNAAIADSKASAATSLAGNLNSEGKNSPGGGFALPAVFAERSKPAAKTAGQESSLGAEAVPAFEPLTLKRKPDEQETAPASASKRLDTGKTEAVPVEVGGGGEGDDSDDESDGSVQLEMVFDEDEESGEEN